MSPQLAESLIVWFLVFGTVALVVAVFVASSVAMRREEPRDSYDAHPPIEAGAAFVLFFTSAFCAVAILALALYRWWPT